jgi:glycosyltransferase involved in cell wall biosynthesis
MPPFISIITVTLNPGALLRATVDSILAQEFADYEHIVKDGGSTDGSTGVLTEAHYVVTGRRQLHVSRDSGIYDAMNQALKLASGRYVYFLNAGDCLLSAQSLADVVAAIPAGKRPELVYTDYRTGPDNQLVRNPNRLSPFFLYRTTLNHQCCLFRRDVMLEGGGFDLSYRVLADFEFLVRLTVKGDTTVLHLPLPLVHYQEGGFSESSRIAQTRRLELRRLRQRHFTPWQRVIFALEWGMTLPGLRQAILRNRLINGMYINIRNKYYKTGFYI